MSDVELIVHEETNRTYYDSTLSQDVKYSLIWLDPDVLEYTDLQTRLQQIIPLMQVCATTQECQSMINSDSYPYSAFILIVASSISQSFIPIVHEIVRVRKIFIYSPNDPDYDITTLQQYFSKVKMVVYSPEELFETISSDWEQCEKPDPFFCYTILNSPDRAMSNSDSSKLWYKLLIQCFSHWSDRTRETDKKELVDLMKKEYQNNASQLKKIDEFDRTYTATDALKWYSKDFCLYRMLNKALRRGNATVLFSFRIFIKDLCTQLLVLSEDQRQSSDRMVRVYRGQAMSRMELANIQFNELLVINTFFSTTLDRQHASGFIVGGVEDAHRSESVLFQIDAQRSIKSSIFADISSVSEIAEEQEVLFIPGSTFRVVSIETDSTLNTTIIQLELCSDDDLEVFDIFKSLEFDMLKTSFEVGCLEYAELLLSLGEYDDAEKAFLWYLNNAMPRKFEEILAYSGLSHVATAVGKYDRAILYSEKVLDIVLDTATINDIDLIGACRLVSVAYTYSRKYDLAFEFGEYALNIAKLIQNSNVKLRLLYQAYDALGFALSGANKPKFALHYYNMTLQIAINIFPFDHPNIGMLYESLGALYLNMENFELSIQYSNHSLDIYKKTLPRTHSRMGDISYNLAVAYAALNNVNDFVISASNAYEIYLYNFPKTHPSFIKAQKLLRLYEVRKSN